ncbi:hypothetical protein N1495_02335 [Streptococcus didelphis]|uniref:Uncharacterized protein n=1 Tax=Streptococcus didelphis TaxID=102886 RepID=A0ABY9LFK6_9STRE|nr:hypothetical protein [Streptococcus didelphis]WMB27700.1 hypothetical protein N1496_06245 [Streptococcus didelphis]WMB29841.1 hypothetical protein N1495_02335 [Streptococcus didelphis]
MISLKTSKLLLTSIVTSLTICIATPVLAISTEEEPQPSAMSSLVDEPTSRFVSINVDALDANTKETLQLVPFIDHTLLEDYISKEELRNRIESKINEHYDGSGDYYSVTNIDDLILTNDVDDKKIRLGDKKTYLDDDQIQLSNYKTQLNNKDDLIYIGENHSSSKDKAPAFKFQLGGQVHVKPFDKSITNPADSVEMTYLADFLYEDENGQDIQEGLFQANMSDDTQHLPSDLNNEEKSNPQGITTTLPVGYVLTSKDLTGYAQKLLDERTVKDPTNPWVIVKRLSSEVIRDTYSLPRHSRDMLFMQEASDNKSFEHTIAKRQKAEAKYDMSKKEYVEQKNTDVIKERYVVVKYNDFKNWLKQQHSIDYNSQYGLKVLYFYDDHLILEKPLDKRVGLDNQVAGKDGTIYKPINSIVIADKVIVNTIKEEDYQKLTSSKIEELENKPQLLN